MVYAGYTRSARAAVRCEQGAWAVGVSDLDVLQRLSLLLALAGVAAIYVSSTVYTVPSTDLEAVSRSDAGKTVAVTADISDVRRHDGTTFLTLADGAERMDAVAFDGLDTEVSPEERYTVEGRVNLYHGSLELIVDTVQPADG